MTQIDRISFDFVVPGEELARGLLSGREPFCHRCFEQVVEEFFAPYDQDGQSREFENIEIDLGSIPEERLYEEYPRRLRDALRKTFSFEERPVGRRGRTRASRHIDNILFGLKYGYLSEVCGEWDIDSFFDAEAAWLEQQPEAVRKDCIDEMAGLALSEDGALRRMILHIGSDALRLRVFGVAISKPDYTVWQRNRFLLSFLDLDGSVPVRFIHESDGKTDLSRMAELLDSGAVRRIMQIEMERQAKPGLSYYWHYLYEWLLRYYPYNDVSLFGGKSQFVSHLHLKFLTFIHKRPFMSFNSEYELTVQFLQEVFGDDKYIHVAEAINRLLNQNVGNVTRYSRYGESLYLSFLRIAQLHQREAVREEAVRDEAAGRSARGAQPAAAEGEPAAQDTAGQARRLKLWLLRRDISEQDKRNCVERFWACCRNSYSEAVVLLQSEGLLAETLALTDAPVIKEMMRQSARRGYAKESLPAVLLVSGWIRENAGDEGRVREYLAPVATEDYVSEALASVSLALLDTVQRVRRAVFASRCEFAWLQSFPSGVLAEAWNRSVLLWLSGRQADGPADVAQLLVLFHRELVGTGSHPEKDDWIRWVAETSGDEERLAELEESAELQAFAGSKDVAEDRRETSVEDALQTLLDEDVPEATRRRVLLFCLYNRPWELLRFIRYSVRSGGLPETTWCEWLELEELRGLACAISVAAAETFMRMLETINLDRRTECRVWVASLVRCDDREWLYNTMEENVEQFVAVLAGHSDKSAPVSACQPERSERPPIQETAVEVGVSFSVENAGLCLLAPWFVRLFIILGYLDPERKKFVNTYSRIRAVFLLQYLVYGEERKYPESDLVFNRLLADIPFHLPLPDWLPLTDEEKRVADEMLAGVKANWRQMDGTSVAGFRRSFIERSGRLKRNEDRWTLVVEEKAFDVLLDTVPWGFRQIVLPWINGFVQVFWRNEQTT